MAFDKKFLLATTFIAGFAVMAPSLAVAQTQPAAQQQEEDDDDDASTQVSTVVITGSRIRRNEYTSSAPIQVLTSEQAQLEGLVDTAELLQSSSLASGSFQFNNQLTGFVTEGGGSTNTISLRGLGSQRTLVLLNGRRLGPAGTRGTVGPIDLNVIPSSLIERVEILKDGASSIYGSDAIAGVINFITRTNLDGFEADAYVRRSFDGGGDIQNYSLGFGSTFDRGYIQAGLDYYRQDPLRRGDRPGTSCAADYLFNPTTMERIDYTSALTGETLCFNLANNSVTVLNSAAQSLGGFVFRRPGITYPTAGQGATQSFVLHPSMIRQGRNGFPLTFPYSETYTPFYDRATLLSPVDRYTITANGGFDLTPNIELYGEFLYNRRQSEQDGVRQLFPQLRSGNVNARQPDGTPFGSSAADRVQPIIALTSDSDQVIDYYRFVGGIRGSFGSGVGFLSSWDWDLYYQYSRSDGEYTDQIIYRDRMNALGDTRDFSAASVAGHAPFLLPCYQDAPTGNVLNPGNVSGYSCASLPGGIPWTSQRILSGNFTDAERAFIFGSETGTTEYIHQYVEGSIAGDLFELPAGMVGVALGFQLREEELDDTPGAQSQLGNRWGQTSAIRTAGSDSVREVFGELEIPLVRGFVGIEDLTMTASARWSDYDSYGSSETYKLGLNWQITPAWRVRATRGTSFRAPSLFEQYLGNQTGFLGRGAIDACSDWQTETNPVVRANCASLGIPDNLIMTGSATILTGGGAGVLEAETAEATTFGVIWTPSFIDLSVAVDYFDITVEDEVAQFGAANIIFQCMSSPTFPADPFCTLFDRDPVTHLIGTVNNSYVNVQSQDNRGIDLSVRYSHEFGFGDLTLDGAFTWQLEDVTQLLGGSAPNSSNGDTSESDFTGQTQARFDRGDWTFTWTSEFYSKASDTEDFGGDVFGSGRYTGVVPGSLVYYKQYTEFVSLHHFSVRYRMDDWTFRAGIRNVFDEYSPSASAGQFRQGTTAIGIPSTDLFLGRSGFIGVTRRF